MTPPANDNGARPRHAAPPGTCDTHIHIYGPPEVYPEAPTSRVRPPDAPLPAYRAVMARLGIERVVIVQPSSYGKNNRCTLDAMRELGPVARGVVVLDDSIEDAELERLTGLGVCGLRFFMLPGGALPWSLLEPMAARIAPFGWHIQLQMDGRDMAERERQLLDLPVRLVIDHTGKFLEPVGVDHPGFRTLLKLVEARDTWVKLSAPYETSKSGPPGFDDVGVLARALLETAPERMVWASNWPHPSAQDNPPDDALLLDVIFDWAGDEALAKRVLVDNPAALYGF